MSRALVQDEPIVGREPAPAGSLHERDLCAWIAEQVALLKAGRTDALDLANIAEELSDLGSEQYDKLESALEVLLMHMLKWDHQPERRSRSWLLTISEQRKRTLKQLRKNPSLKPRIGEAVADAYDLARIRAARDTDLEPDFFPAECPYTWSDILEREFRYIAPEPAKSAR
jgi:hypothetical protein